MEKSKRHAGGMAKEKQEKTGRGVSWGGPGGKKCGTHKASCLDRGIALQRSLADAVCLPEQEEATKRWREVESRNGAPGEGKGPVMGKGFSMESTD